MPQRWSLLTPFRLAFSTSLILAALLLVASCAKDDSPPGEEGGTGGALDTPDLFGTVAVLFQEATQTREASAIAVGRLYDRPPIPLTPLVVERTEGDCQFFSAQVPLCTEPCKSGTLCVADSECAPYPQAQDVGEIRITGLGDEDVLLEPFPPSYIYQSDDLPHPPCVEGAEVVMTAGPHTATVTCIEPLEFPEVGAIPVTRGEPVLLSWTPAPRPELGRIRVLLDVSHHGGKKGEITCDTEDAGSLEIPASLVTALIDQGLAGFPSIFVSRLSQVKAQGRSEVLFEVASTVERPVDTGITSCLTNDDCPDGEVCNQETLICQ